MAAVRVPLMLAEERTECISHSVDVMVKSLYNFIEKRELVLAFQGERRT
jgi:hypothetical protein